MAASRIPTTELATHVDQTITQVFAYRNLKRVGDCFVTVLYDKDGTIRGFGDRNRKEEPFDGAACVKVRGIVEFHDGKLQITIKAIRPAKQSEFDRRDFVHGEPWSAEEVKQHLLDIRDMMSDPDCQRLLTTFAEDPKFTVRLGYMPTSIGGTLGGQISHTERVTGEAWDIAERYAGETDMALLAAVLHACGEVYALEVAPTITKSWEGKLLPGVALTMVQIAIRATKCDFPYEKLVLLEHHILAHEVKLFHLRANPQFIEAEAVRQAHATDDRMTSARRRLPSVATTRASSL